MDHKTKILEMRTLGIPLRTIARRLGISVGRVSRCLYSDVQRPVPVADNDNTIIMMMPFNAGCSSASGPRPIKMPRLRFLERAAA